MTKEEHDKYAEKGWVHSDEEQELKSYTEEDSEALAVLNEILNKLKDE